ncbi:acid protease [Thozetella sp. PMI_491]|nr:acid protease [Thozetella sp. PMI_491]
MKTSTRYLISLGLGVANAQVHLPFSRLEGNLEGITQRDSQQLGLRSGDFVYVANISVGTPPQSMQVVLTQSMGDTWVPDAQSSYCDTNYYSSYDTDDDYYSRYTGFCKWGSFNQTKSSTYADANVKYSSFSAYTADGDYVSGSNFTDTLKVGDLTLDNYPMGLVSDAPAYIGALGLGQNRSYSSYSSSSSSRYGYVHFLDKLVQTGKIPTAAYSMWLDDAEGTSGSLLLGAIDTSRFEGTLTRLSGYQSTSYVMSYNFGIEIYGINATDKSSNPMTPLTGNDFPLPVAISAGEALSTFPSSLTSKIWTAAGASYNRTVRKATIPCNASGSARFNLQLAGADGPVLDVELKDLILSPSVLSPTYAYYMKSTPDMCVFGIQNGSSSSSYDYYNIGASLLRRSYLVFDTSNLEVAIAPVKFAASNPGTSNVVAFSGLGAAAPSATMYCGDTSSYYCRETCTANCNPTGTGSSSRYTSTGTSSGSGNDDDDTYLSGPWLQTALGVGITFGIIGLIAIVAGIILWRRALAKKNAAAQSKEVDEESAPGTAPQPEMTGARGTLAPGTESYLPPINEASLPPLPPRQPSPLSDVGETTTPRSLAAVPEEPTARPPSPPTDASSKGKGKEPVV